MALFNFHLKLHTKNKSQISVRFHRNPNSRNFGELLLIKSSLSGAFLTNGDELAVCAQNHLNKEQKKIGESFGDM